MIRMPVHDETLQEHCAVTGHPSTIPYSRVPLSLPTSGRGSPSFPMECGRALTWVGQWGRWANRWSCDVGCRE